MRRNPNALCRDGQDYYSLPDDGSVTLDQVHACWMFRGAKPWNWSEMRIRLPIAEAWPWRLFRYRGYDRDLAYWDDLTASMQQHGWMVEHPLLIVLGRDGCMSFEGNHRLQIAAELGIDTIPAKIGDFWDSACEYPTGLQPYLLGLAAKLYPDAIACEWEEFRRAIFSLTQGPRRARNWNSLVGQAIAWCEAAGAYSEADAESNRRMLDTHRLASDKRRLQTAYRQWRTEQFESMRELGYTWPLPLQWPAVTLEQIRELRWYVPEDRPAPRIERLREADPKTVEELLRLLGQR